MGSEGYCSDTIIGGAARRGSKKRESLTNFSCISPRLILSRWFNGENLRSSEKAVDRGEKKGKVWGRFDVKSKNKAVKCSMKCHASSSSSPEEPEHAKEASFNLGIGFGLIYLIAASRNELSQMVELHKQTKMLLQNLRTEFQNQENRLLMPSESRISHSLSKPGAQEVLCTKENVSLQLSSSDDIEKSESDLGYSRYPNKKIYRRDRSLRMDQLEAELETEFCRLQLQMDNEYMLEYKRQQCTEMNLEDTAPEDSFSTSSKEIIDQPELREYYGVHPGELACRLHELLEERQQERIKELESALECATHKLHEKERELSWWKDTATFISPFQSLACRSRRKIPSQTLES
ncbi:Protein POLAR DURING ASYMMETRIC DIVISION AND REDISTRIBUTION [Forsythia ovata]|uniref:Protein POLAR DURING ASYMMETRIC DIVISION AND REDISTRIBUTION n=1 Tax=Forsythia ovata TaxID=205694 RepID=A0ABD1W7D9_9LAMI